MSGSRRRARERALQALYQVDIAHAEPSEALRAAFGAQEHPSERETQEFAQELVEGVLAHLEDIDGVIQRHSLHWRVDRMPRIDRNVLRLAVFELLHRSDVPKKVVLNEAIELGKLYGSEESSSFINAILDKVAQELPER